MSPINFEPIAERHPDLALAIRAIEWWISRMIGVQFIELKRLARELSAIQEKHLALALEAIVSSGQMREVHRVRDPQRHLLPENYADPTLIPDCLLNRDDEYAFSLDEGEIVHGFLLEPKRGSI